MTPKNKTYERGPKHGNWEGGSKSTDSERAREAWERLWGKKIPKGYIVEHKDGNPENNSRANLHLVTLAEHNRKHKKGKTWKTEGRGIKAKKNVSQDAPPQRRFR